MKVLKRPELIEQWNVLHLKKALKLRFWFVRRKWVSRLLLLVSWLLRALYFLPLLLGLGLDLDLRAQNRIGDQGSSYARCGDEVMGLHEVLEVLEDEVLEVLAF
ncbi:hypothetical protein Tco_0871325 [Tanacetum coccineum]